MEIVLLFVLIFLEDMYVPAMKGSQEMDSFVLVSRNQLFDVDMLH